MKMSDLIRLLPTFEFSNKPDKGYTIYVPLRDLVDVFERNNLKIETKIPEKVRGEVIKDLDEVLQMLGDGPRCLSCGYKIKEFDTLYEGYGCPKCESPLVVVVNKVGEEEN